MEKSGNNYQPARGLLRLTWPQIELIDAKVSSLCAFTEENGGEARLVIVIKKGKVRFVETVESEELRPNRP